MRAGDYNRRISFERRLPGKNAFGTENGEWIELKPWWAKIKALNGREFFAGVQVQSDVTTQVSCRYSPCFHDQLTTKDRIVRGQMVYDIRAILGQGEGGDEISFLCTVHSINSQVTP